jgi:hypothetical protein
MIDHAKRPARPSQSRPEGRSWPELTELVLDRADIESLLDELDSMELFMSPEKVAIRQNAIADVKQRDSEGPRPCCVDVH